MDDFIDTQLSNYFDQEEVDRARQVIRDLKDVPGAAKRKLQEATVNAMSTYFAESEEDRRQIEPLLDRAIENVKNAGRGLTGAVENARETGREVKNFFMDKLDEAMTGIKEFKIEP